VIHDFRKEEPMNRDRFWLTDAQFSKIEPHLPTDARGKARVDDRRVISGIVQVLKSGRRWIDALDHCRLVVIEIFYAVRRPARTISYL